MSKTAFSQKIHEQNVDSCKKWLCDTAPIDVRQGLDDIFSNSIKTPKVGPDLVW